MATETVAGTGNESFTLVFKEGFFKKGDLLNGEYLVVLNLRMVWWRRLLRFFGIETMLEWKYKVKPQKSEIT
jgi:hypothetical protein